MTILPVPPRVVPFLFLTLGLFLTTMTSCEEDTPEDEMMENQAPTEFDLVFLSDNATDVVFSPYLSWTQSTDPDGGSVTYRLIMDKTADLTLAGESEPSTVIAEGINRNAYAMTQALLQGTEYTWRVVAVDGQGESTKSTTVRSFITAMNGTANNAPGIFDLVSPTNGELDVPLSPLLTWSPSVDPDGDPVTYDVYLFEQNGTGGMISSFNPNTSTTPISLNYETWYEWDVVAYDNKGFWRESTSVFEFLTEEEPGPTTMSLLTDDSPLQSEGRYGHQNVLHNGSLYTIGGYVLNAGGGGDRNDVWRLDGDNWTQVREHDPYNGPHPSSESQVVSLGGLLYVFNGERNTIQTSPDGNIWNWVSWEGSVAEGTHYGPVQGHQVVVMNDVLYLIGGSSGGLVNNDVWMSSDFGVTWAEISDHSFPARRDHQVVVKDGLMYLMGGTSSGQRLNDFWISTNGSSWTQQPDAPWSPRTNHHCAVYDGMIYLSGGDVGGDSDEIWRYNESLLLWEEVSIDPEFTARESHYSIEYNGRLYIDLGKNGALPLNDTWVID